MWRSWNLFRDMDLLHREMQRVFNEAWGGESDPFKACFLPGKSARTYPLINIAENPEAVVVEALAPGLNPESLEVTVKGKTLTLAGEKKPLADVRREAYHRSERAAGRFVRTIHLDSEVDEDEVNARYIDGVLTVTMPKSERARPKQIEVQVG